MRDDNISNTLEADIYISTERVEDNAKTNQETIEKETLRVIIHGVLHLCGLNDKSKKQKEQMRRSENELIELYNAMFHVE
jgi:rRNA maturation RNase YbeY